jgi:GNAT superfamily N-acetyltransferase
MTAATQIRETTLHLRSAADGDEVFLQTLYVRQIAAELEAAGMTAAQREVIAKMQFAARELSYTTYYPTASNQLITLECGTPIGRILVERTGNNMRLIDIALLPEQRGRGFGTRLLQGLQQECERPGGILSLQVLKESAAERLYRRLGFVITGEDTFRRQMVWTKDPQNIAPNRELC